MKNIEGTVQYQDLEGGFWSIIGKRGKQWRPVQMPDQLKTPGKKVSVKANVIKGEMSVFQWGTPIEITGFNT